MLDKFVSFVRFIKIYCSSRLLNIRVNLFDSKISVGICFVLGKSLGGGNNGSTAIFSEFYIIFGIIRASNGEPKSRHGFVFTYMSQVSKLSSIIKSNPKISKLNSLWFESRSMQADFMASAALFYNKSKNYHHRRIDSIVKTIAFIWEG